MQGGREWWEALDQRPFASSILPVGHVHCSRPWPLQSPQGHGGRDGRRDPDRPGCRVPGQDVLQPRDLGQVDASEPFRLAKGGPKGAPQGCRGDAQLLEAPTFRLEAGSRHALPANTSSSCRGTHKAVRVAGAGRPDTPCGFFPSKPLPWCPHRGAGGCPHSSPTWDVLIPCLLHLSSEAGAASRGGQSSSADSAGSSALGHRVRLGKPPTVDGPGLVLREAGGGEASAAAHPPKDERAPGALPSARLTGHALGPAGSPRGNVNRKCAGVTTRSQGPAHDECRLYAEPRLQCPGV